MKEFIDRVPSQGKANRKKITYSDNSTEYVFIENADEPSVSGTPIDRSTMTAIQGFKPTTFTHNDNVFKEESYTGDNKETLTTTINIDGTITQVFEGALIGGVRRTITNTITFSENRYTEVLS